MKGLAVSLILFCVLHMQAQKSIKTLEQNANRGDLSSQLALGDAYNFGRGTGINYRKAEDWYKRAVAQRSGYAAYMIGQEYQLDHRSQTRGLLQIPVYDPAYAMQMAQAYMLQATALGYPAAFGWMGWYYEEGYRMGRTEGDASSITTVQPPAQQPSGGGFIGGLVDGLTHKNGDDQTVIKSSTSMVGGANYSEAATWYSRGADLEDISSELGLGHLYEQGLGVVKSPKLAIRYYEKAMLEGSPEADAKYKLLTEQYGNPSPQDLELPSALCNDGLYSFSHNRSGTCASHQGVKNWIDVKLQPEPVSGR